MNSYNKAGFKYEPPKPPNFIAEYIILSCFTLALMLIVYLIINW